MPDVYRVSWFDRIDGERYQWTPKKRETSSIVKALRADERVTRGPVVDLLTIPTGKVALAAWLNDHLSSGNV